MNKKAHLYDEYFECLIPALKSKAEELEFFGYGDINEELIWSYLVNKKWKKPQEGVRVHQLVSDIIAVKPGDFMSFATMQAYRSPNWFEDLNHEELQVLLNPKKS